jgi:hypothetical protein
MMSAVGNSGGNIYEKDEKVRLGLDENLSVPSLSGSSDWVRKRSSNPSMFRGSDAGGSDTGYSYFMSQPQRSFQSSSDVGSSTSTYSEHSIFAKYRKRRPARRPRPWDSPSENTPLLLRQHRLENHVIGTEEEDDSLEPEHEEEEGNQHPPLWSGRFLSPSSENHRSSVNKKYFKKNSFSSWSHHYGTVMTLHFACVALYDSFSYYRSIRLGKNKGEIPVTWISYLGRFYNPAVGPSATTLNAFGVFNPGLVLVNNQWWRFISSLTLCTSFVQWLLNFFTCFHLVKGQKSNFVSWRVCLLSSFMGGLWTCIAICTVGAINNTEEDAKQGSANAGILPTTGLTSAGIAGVLAAVLVQQWDKKFFGIYIIQMTSTYLLPFTSIASVWGGTIMGILCGFYNKKEPRITQKDTETNKNYKTPVQIDHSSLISPPPSSQTGDSLYLRHSSLVSPDEEEQLERYKFNDNNNHIALSPTTNGHKEVSHGKSWNPQRSIAVCGILILWSVSVWLLSVFAVEEQLPSTREIMDSMYGCQTVRSLIITEDKYKQRLCAEVCVPVWYNYESINNGTVSSGTCANLGFRCFSDVDNLQISAYVSIQRDLYSQAYQGSC